MRLIILFLALCSVVHAANFYVRPNGGSYGSENGADWTNAFDGFTDINWAGVSAGDTVWVAGGTYTQDLSPTASGSSGNVIAVRRARADAVACTGADGWSAGFDATVTQNDVGIVINGNYSYITISGRTTSAGGSHGWHISFKGTTTGQAIWMGSAINSDFVTVEYMDVEGPGDVIYTGDSGRGADLTPLSGGSSDWLLSHVKIWDWETGIQIVGMSAVIMEYIEMYDMSAVNSDDYHPNGIITWSAPDCIVRYSLFHKGPGGHPCGEGIFFEQNGESTDWQIYGNLFYDMDEPQWKAIEITSAVGAIQVYNNTFVNISNGSLYTSDSPSAVGGLWKNNLNYLSSDNTIGTAANNMESVTSAIFVDFAAKNFHIVDTVAALYPRDKGADLGAPWNVDRDGVNRGEGAAWDVGAYEYAGGGAATSASLSGTVSISGNASIR